MSTIRVDNFGPSAGGTTYSARGIAKAWVNFNGTGTIAARDSENVSSLTDNGTGNYAVNFSSVFGDANYAATMNARAGGGVQSIITLNRDATPSAAAHYIYVVNPSTPLTLQDEAFVNVALHGDLA